MAMVICHVAPELDAKLKQFRFRKAKTLGAILMKINKSTLTVEIEEEYEDTTIEEIANEIPPQQPRFIIISYPLNHDDGRVSYPMLFIFISPQGCNPELQMMYAGSKNEVVGVGQFTKLVEYRNLDEFTDEAVRARLNKV